MPPGLPARISHLRARFYRNCEAARAAGVAPLYAGEPGYRGGMDADGDGIACEPYRGW
ncbi:excalibur calcium-binding domain-containing protein [Novosphingobium colocasiae]